MVAIVTRATLLRTNIDISTRNTGSYARVTHSREYISDSHRVHCKYYLAVDVIKITYSYVNTTISLIIMAK